VTVVKKITLNFGLAWLIEEIELIGPKIGDVAFHVGTSRLRDFESQSKQKHQCKTIV
jgi:hypothetical protein